MQYYGCKMDCENCMYKSYHSRENGHYRLVFHTHTHIFNNFVHLHNVYGLIKPDLLLKDSID